MIAWRIYYGDGSTFSNLDGRPEDAPARNVQIIAQTDPDTGYSFPRSNDYYVMLPSGWEGVDIFGLWDYLAAPGLKVVKFGRTIGNKAYADLLTLAMGDPDLPPKSAWRPNERRVKDG